MRRDLIVNPQACSDDYEAIIREYPDQWLWRMGRWETQPKGETLEACLATIRN
jgi:lauroyl/myristoyl acyltransferase